MIILSTAAMGDGRATLSRGYSYSKNERLELRNEEMWERNRGRESKTLTREKSHSNEIGSIWKVCFFGTHMHIYWPHLIMDHQSETERAWEGGRQQSHMKGDWDYIFHFSTAILNHQNHLHLKVRPASLAYCQVLFVPFCLDRKRIILYLECNLWFLIFFFRNEITMGSQQISISYSVTA